jgi:hypothetical protein
LSFNSKPRRGKIGGENKRNKMEKREKKKRTKVNKTKNEQENKGKKITEELKEDVRYH